jgi:putative FmdB family regulatory protein
VPTYEYQCDKCGRVFEVQQRISAPPLESCEECGGAVRRLISPAAFILKGEGWYVTDYPSEARKKARESEKSAAGGTDTKSGEKTEKKPETTSKPTTSAPSSAPSTSPSSGSSD